MTEATKHARTQEKKKKKNSWKSFFFQGKSIHQIKGYMVALTSVHLGVCMGVWVRLLEGRTKGFPLAPWTEAIKTSLYVPRTML